MYHKIRNTLASLAIATAVLGLSYSVGQPPMQPVASVEPGSPIASEEAVRSPGLGATTRGMRSQLSMPFFSFAPLLPRQGT